MLSIEIRVNGHPVSVIEAYRDPTGGGVADYPYRGWQFPLDRDDDPKWYEGVVRGHHFRDGIHELARRIYECIEIPESHPTKTDNNV